MKEEKSWSGLSYGADRWVRRFRKCVFSYTAQDGLGIFKLQRKVGKNICKSA